MMPAGVVRDQRLNKNELKILMALYYCRSAKTSQCHPTRGYLAECTGVREQDVSAITTSLQKKGWLEKEGRGGYSKASVYTMFWSDDDSIPDQTTVRKTRRVDGEGKGKTTVRVFRTRKEQSILPITKLQATKPPIPPSWATEVAPF